MSVITSQYDEQGEYFGCSISWPLIGARQGSPTEPIGAGYVYDARHSIITRGHSFGSRFGVCVRHKHGRSGVGAYKAQMALIDDVMYSEDAEGYGYSLDLHGDDVAIGAYKDRKVYVYRGGKLLTVLFGSHEFGRSIRMDGDTLVVGADGAAYIYENYELKEVLFGPKGFGSSVDVGSRIAVGAHNSDYVGIYERDNYVPSMELYGPRGTWFGGCVRLNGNRIAVGAAKASDDWYGYSLDWDGNDLLVGAPRGNYVERTNGYRHVFSW